MCSPEMCSPEVYSPKMLTELERILSVVIRNCLGDMLNWTAHCCTCTGVNQTSVICLLLNYEVQKCTDVSASRFKCPCCLLTGFVQKICTEAQAHTAGKGDWRGLIH